MSTMRKFILAFGALWFGCAGILAAGWAGVTLLRSEFLSAGVAANIGVFFMSFSVPVLKILSNKIDPQLTSDGYSTKSSPDKVIELTWNACLASAVIGMGLFAVFYPLGKLDIPVPHSMRYSIPFMGGAVAVMAVPMLWRNLKRGGSKLLCLTPDGFEISEGSTSSRGAWEDVCDVTDRVPGESPPKDYHVIVMVMSDGQAPTLSADSFTPGGRALREWVRFYWQHPECRDELTDGRAVERLRGEEFSSE